MHIVLGATGHVGSSVAHQLLDAGEDVLIITRREDKARAWRNLGASSAVVDVNDTKALTDVFAHGSSLFLLNPPARPDTNTVREEKKSLQSILHALERSSIENVVAESTYGARRGDGLGDLGVLFEMEEYLRERGYKAHLIRAAYYMSNWDAFLTPARDKGILFTLYPIDLQLPMVAPIDVGAVAARLLKALDSDPSRGALHYVEGPRRYSASDVAQAYSRTLGRKVRPVSVPEPEWIPYLKRLGFSDVAAGSMATMTKLTLNSVEDAITPIRGPTTIETYIQSLIDEGVGPEPSAMLNHGELSL